ncbi:GNAT family N-acetyltransferase [Paucibacter soli]|uniref:GNAT family N-acetyltransferase n=1 Tax=Paucibacter soli TaxID=3133433 RepID=UPI0030A5C4E4
MMMTMMMTGGARTELHTPRLLLRAPHVGLSAAVSDFYLRNQAHFAPWDPPTPPCFYAPEAVAARMQQASLAFDEGTAYRWWICSQQQPTRVIGQCQVSQVSRAAFQSAILGYSLCAQVQGRGLMHEALSALRDEVFGPRIALHRLQAGVRPENLRSRRVLERLGFAHEGHSKRYLFINGAWRDHDLYALINPAWPDEQLAYGS